MIANVPGFPVQINRETQEVIGVRGRPLKPRPDPRGRKECAARRARDKRARKQR